MPPLPGRLNYGGLVLDFNERTRTPSERVIAELREAINGKLTMYPEYEGLAEAIASYASVQAANVLVTNGSDEAISLIFRTFVSKGDTVIIPEPSFSMFIQEASLCGASVVRPQYDPDSGTFPQKDVMATVARNPKLVVLCNPNNPTGTIIPVTDIETIAQGAQDTIILVDEAYAEFSGVSVVPLLSRYPNIVITRTFSKAFGLAALRIGYMIGNPQLLGEIQKIKGPYDVNALAAAAAKAALTDIPNMKSYTDEVMTRSKPMLETFFAENAIPFCPSGANFLFIRVPDAITWEETLRRNGVLVRRFSKPGMENRLRITIGTVSETNTFIETYTRCFVKNARTKKKIAFIDRDGTVIFEPQKTFQINSVSELTILPGVIPTLRRLVKRGYVLVMVTNQDGVGTAVYPRKNYESVQTELMRRLKRENIRFRKVFMCPHTKDTSCSCRKPKTGMLTDFLTTTGLDTKRSFVCGDRESDRLLAQNLGIPFVAAETNGDMGRAFERSGFWKEEL